MSVRGMKEFVLKKCTPLDIIYASKTFNLIQSRKRKLRPDWSIKLSKASVSLNKARTS